MKAAPKTPAVLFGYDVRFVVPVFQRVYVWDQESQWEPLWNDIRILTERYLDANSELEKSAAGTHFLGAVVLDAVQSGDYLPVHQIIDGQQRLTTLQVLLNAMHRVALKIGAKRDADSLGKLVRNSGEIEDAVDEVFKVWPTDKDQDSFREVMLDGFSSHLKKSAIARAHQYFEDEILEWLDDKTIDAEKVAKFSELSKVVRTKLSIVSIELESEDNPQVIFEALNYRGKPLLAADLVKNLILQRALNSGMNQSKIYLKYWARFDDPEEVEPFWREKVARGRLKMPRIDVFINHWLIMTLGVDVSPDRIYSSFKEILDRRDSNLEHVLADLSLAADNFQELYLASDESTLGRFKYRIFDAVDAGVFMPVVLWLMQQQSANAISQDERDQTLAVIESWLVRRALCNLTSKDNNRAAQDLLKLLIRNGAPGSAAATTDYFKNQSSDTRYWPTDEYFKDYLVSTPIYTSAYRAHLRMLLEALEEEKRNSKTEEKTCPRRLTIEHLMPQAWRSYWNKKNLSDEESSARDLLIHRLGNLTLVNEKLNPALSNQPWTEPECRALGLSGVGKRLEISNHSTLLMNSEIVERNREAWEENSIIARSKELAEIASKIWARPAGGPQLASKSKDGSLRRGKYSGLTEFLTEVSQDEVPLTFEMIEEIIGAKLPASSFTHLSHWYGQGSSLNRAFAESGFSPRDVCLDQTNLIAVRQNSGI